MHACTRRGISSSHALALSVEQRRTCGIGEPEGDRLVFDVAHVANGHLARVVGKVFGSEVLDLQHLGFALRDGTQHSPGFSAWKGLANRCGFRCVSAGSAAASGAFSHPKINVIIFKEFFFTCFFNTQNMLNLFIVQRLVGM